MAFRPFSGWLGQLLVPLRRTGFALAAFRRFRSLGRQLSLIDRPLEQIGFALAAIRRFCLLGGRLARKGCLLRQIGFALVASRRCCPFQTFRGRRVASRGTSFLASEWLLSLSRESWQL